MRIRQPALAAALVLMALGVTGCTAPTGPVEGVTGLTVAAGRVQAVVHSCRGVTANEVHLRSGGSWHFDAARSATVDLGSVDGFGDTIGSRRQTLQASTSAGVGGS